MKTNMKIKLAGNALNLNLFKTFKGAVRPNYKYLWREPDGKGNYRYYYEHEKTKQLYFEDYSKEHASKLYPEHFNLQNKHVINNDTKLFIDQSELANSNDKIFGSKDKSKKTFKEYVDALTEKYKIFSQISSLEGVFNEIVRSFSKEIAEETVEDINDLVRLANLRVSLFKNNSDEYSKEVVELSSKFLANIKAMADSKNPICNSIIDRTWKSAKNSWFEVKTQLFKIYGYLNLENIRIRHSGKDVGSDRKADIFVEIKEDSNWVGTKIALSLKVNRKKPISFSEGSVFSAFTKRLIKSDSAELKELALELEKKYNELEKKFDKRKILDDDVHSSEIMYRFQYEVFKSFGLDKITKNYDGRTEKQKRLCIELAKWAMKENIDLHYDPKTDNLALSMTHVIDDRNFEYIGCSSKALKKEWEKTYNEGVVSIKWKQLDDFYNSITGEKIPKVSSCEFVIGPAENRVSFFIVEFRHKRKNIQLRGPVDINLEHMRRASKIDSGYGVFKKYTDIGVLKSEILQFDQLFKADTSRHRPNSKFIRKILTDSGKIRYIYKETMPRQKKVENDEASFTLDFLNKLESSNEEYAELFKEACKQIESKHFLNINAGTTAIKITNNYNSFADFLGATDEQRNNLEFKQAHGSYGVKRGRIAFCLNNFPSEISAIVKKRTMLHEVGHAYFFGTLRIKENKLINQLDLNKLAEISKESIKFVDQFGKIDKEMRNSIAENNDNMTVKNEKNTVEQISSIFVDAYSSIDAIEHFAQAFAYYFVIPELLKKKEIKVYNHFNSYFKKYKG
jgi:hypothetical protein